MKRISGTKFWKQNDSQKGIVNVWGHLEELLKSKGYLFNIDKGSLDLYSLWYLGPKDQADYFFPLLNVHRMGNKELEKDLIERLSLSRTDFLREINLALRNNPCYPTIGIGSLGLSYVGKENGVKFKVVPSLFSEGTSKDFFRIPAHYYNSYKLSYSPSIDNTMGVYVDCPKDVEKGIKLLYRSIRNFLEK
tara:strand:+ start:211 stop:783 length:573 start_codon:yes stop_codon:yes gene_type:complete